MFAIEYPSYGPAEGEASEESVNDNLITAYRFLIDLGYPSDNIILMGYSIGTGPVIQLASSLCEGGMPPAAVITVAAFLSICDIVRDLRGSVILSLLSSTIDNRWNSAERITQLTCPILFVHGGKDEIIPADHSRRLHELCRSRRKFIKICEDATHTHFSEPADTAHPIANFFSDVFTSQSDIKIRSVPLSRYDCPESIFLRETEIMKGS